MISRSAIGPLCAIVDYLLIVLSSIVAGIVYHSIVFGQAGDVIGFAQIGNNAALVFILLIQARGLYKPTEFNVFARQLRGVVAGWAVTLFIVILFFFFLKIGESNSRGAFVVFGLLGLGVLVGSRYLTTLMVNSALDSGFLWAQRVVIIGEDDELTGVDPSHLLKKFNFLELARFKLKRSEQGVLSLSRSDLSIIDAAIDAARSGAAEKIVLLLRWNNRRRCDLICEQLRRVPVRVVLLPDRVAESILMQPTIQIGSHFAVELQRAPLSKLELIAKRMLDLAIAAPALLIFAPLFAIVSIAIRLESPGPIIFRQRRNGFNSREFGIYKFRTMNVVEDGEKINQATRNDTRVTFVGRLLRMTSIDELPQLINVLRGEMSLVGPRPHAIAHDYEYSESIANYAFRQHVKPGITGWAQVHGFRGGTTELELMEQRIELDLWYINNWSLMLDLKILVFTCVELVRGRNAY